MAIIMCCAREEQMRCVKEKKSGKIERNGEQEANETIILTMRRTDTVCREG